MWSGFLSWLEVNQVGNLADFATLLLIFVGFWRSIWAINKSRTAAEASKVAAEQAEKAAVLARDAVLTFDAIVDFSSVISVLEEIKRAHRHGHNIGLPERYASTRKLLIAIKSANPDLVRLHGQRLQVVITNLADMEKSVEKMIETNQNLKATRFNSIIMDDIDSLVEVLGEWKRAKLEGAA